MDLRGKRVLLTGASSGIGEAAAEIAVICGTDARYGTEVTEVVEAARAAGEAMIQKAIDTGETLAKDGGVAAAILEPEKK